MINRKYTWKPDLPDHRDYPFVQLAVSANFKVSKLPPSINLRKWCPEIFDQGNLGSCTANAVAGLLGFNQNYLKKTPYRDLSRLFIYFNERTLENTISEDSGASLRDGIQSVNKWGVCTESDWPYNIDKFTIKPTDGCYKSALKYKISSYYRISSLNEMKTSLANGHPFVFGMSVYESFESDQVANTGIIPMPGQNEQLLGGHALLGVGYDDATQMFLIRNSWGKNWGLKGTLAGYCWIPYAYLSNTNLADDFWATTQI